MIMKGKKILMAIVWIFALGFVVLNVLHYVWYKKDFVKSLYMKAKS